MPQLEKKLRGMSTSSPKAIEILLSTFVADTFLKGSIIGMPGHSFPVLYYLETGLIRTFINDDGIDHTFWIMDNGFILPPKGFFNMSNSSEYIQVLEDSVVWSLNLVKAELLAKEDPALYRMLLEIYEEKIKLVHEHLIILNISDGMKRFSAYMEQHKNIPSKINNNQLASLLRINPKHLYKIKQQYYRNK